jgi:hypothetical protein
MSGRAAAADLLLVVVLLVMVLLVVVLLLARDGLGQAALGGALGLAAEDVVLAVVLAEVVLLAVVDNLVRALGAVGDAGLADGLLEGGEGAGLAGPFLVSVLA